MSPFVRQLVLRHINSSQFKVFLLLETVGKLLDMFVSQLVLTENEFLQAILLVEDI